MAHINLPTSQPFYDAAKRFVDAALRNDDSIFTPGEPIWIPAHIDDLYTRFVLNPDESGDGFDTKFRRQLAGAPPAVYQLAGELIFVHLLIATGNIGGQAKRSLINRVLNWSSAPVTMPPECDAALDCGLARVGTAYLTYRPFQLGFLVEFMRHWKALPAARREEALADPWIFKTELFGLPIHHAYAQREALLHLVYPDTFEAIVSRENKAQFAHKFAALIDTPTGDVDRDLLQIRRALDARHGKGHSFYDIERQPPGPGPGSSPLPRTLGSQLRPYVRLVTLLPGAYYVPAQIVDKLGSITPPIASLTMRPDAEALVRDMLHLRLIQRVEASGNYLRWGFLGDATEEYILRYAALTLLVPQDDGSYDLPALRALFDGQPHPAAAWPYGETLLAWYEEAGLVQHNADDTWQSLPDALAPLNATTSSAKALNTFLGHLNKVRAGANDLPPMSDDSLPLLDPSVLDARIEEIQRELLVDRATILRIYRALVAGQNVILSGPPGTGKTHLAHILPRLLWRGPEPTVQYTLGTDPFAPPTDPPAERPLVRDGYSADVVTATEDWGVRNVRHRAPDPAER